MAPARPNPVHYFAPVIAVILLALPHQATAQGIWSALYPKDWQPGHTDEAGRFLHDFSYAGYKNGEAELPDPPNAPVFDVVADHHADNTGAADATAAIQAAIDAAQSAGGGTVRIPAGLYRCDGTLTVTGSGVALCGEGPESTRLFFTKQEDMSYLAHITFRGEVVREGDILLAHDGETRSKVVAVADASGLNVGDEVAVGWVITDEFVAEHGMTGVWTEFNGQWQPFFRREVTAINTSASPPEITLDVPLRYPAKIRDGASLRKESGYLSECMVSGIGLSNAKGYLSAWSQTQVRALELSGVRDGVVRNVASFSSPLAETPEHHLQSNGIMIHNAKRVTVADCRMGRAQNRGGSGNGYLFEVRQSSEILFRDCIGRDGRHNFIQNWGFGASGIVWLRCTSTGGRVVTRYGHQEFSVTGYSEFHHSLAMANLVDSCTFDDGWASGNRGDESSGAGHSATQNVCWNTTGSGDARIRSFNYGNGYVIGTRGIEVLTTEDIPFGFLNNGTEPFDFTELIGTGDRLAPQSLYLDQLQRRTKPGGIPTDISENYTVTAGGGVCIRVAYPGNADPEGFTWTFTPEMGGDARPLPGARTDTLCIENATLNHAGTYTATFDNGAKTPATHTARLTVVEKMPLPTAAAAGAFLLVLAAGAARLRPQRGGK